MTRLAGVVERFELRADLGEVGERRRVSRAGGVEIEGGLEAGLPDVIAFPDISTLQQVPWEKGVAHVIADVYKPGRVVSLPAATSRRSRNPHSRLGPNSISMFGGWPEHGPSSHGQALLAAGSLGIVRIRTILPTS